MSTAFIGKGGVQSARARDGWMQRSDHVTTITARVNNTCAATLLHVLCACIIARRCSKGVNK